MREQISDDELLSIARQHKEQLKSVKHWNEYRKGKGLPHSQTFISRFGTWNAFKEQLSLEINEQNRPQIFSDEELMDILKKYKNQYIGIKEWDQFAERHGFPTHALFLQRLGMDKVYELTGYTSQWTTEQLKQLILMHFPNTPPTQSDWNSLSSKVRLPSYLTVIRRFGSWNNMKHAVYYN